MSTRFWLLLAVATAASACGPTPTGPAPPIKAPPSQPEVPNSPPTITSLTLSSPRVEAGEDVQVTAVVEDTDTPVDQLAYEWSATPVNGRFSGNGPQVRWTAPASFQTPDLYSLVLKVTEHYTSNGQAKANAVWSGVSVHYNDSRREITRISLRFLTELFPNYSVSAPEAVQDFSNSCRGKLDEFSDVANNRINFHILSGTYTDISISLDQTKTFADVTGTCVFDDIPMNPADANFGRRESVPGICTLTAIYENWRWFLCDSHFKGIAPGVTLESLRYRVPGRITRP